MAVEYVLILTWYAILYAMTFEYRRFSINVILYLEYSLLKSYHLKYSIFSFQLSFDCSDFLDNVPNHSSWAKHLIYQYCYIEISYQAFGRVVECSLLLIMYLMRLLVCLDVRLIFYSEFLFLLFSIDNLVNKSEDSLCDDKEYPLAVEGRTYGDA